jgi:autotransporter-associated beta strand protein
MITALFGTHQALAQSTFLDFSTGLSGWTTAGSVSVLNATDSFIIGELPGDLTPADNEGKPVSVSKEVFSLTPASGESMVRIIPIGSNINGAALADNALGLSAGTIDGLLGHSEEGGVTNFGLLTKTFSFAPGVYKFSWAYAATDYQPFNDGVILSVVGNDSQIITSLARNGSSSSDVTGPDAGTLILGSFGSTPWIQSSFSITTAGAYQVGFASYNWDDDILDPVFYVASSAGTFTGTPVALSGGSSTTNIDTAAVSYSASNLGLTLNPVFDGGTLIANVSTVAADFTVNAAGGSVCPLGNTTSTFSGVIADATGASGFINIIDDGSHGTIVFTGANTYTGATRVASGATLQLTGNGSLASSSIDINSGGTLAGNGTVHGSVTNSGVVSPGNSLGCLTVAGNYTEAGTLRIEIDGAAGAGVNPGGYDRLVVGGTAALQSGSVLQLTRSAANSFEPTWGQRFRVLAATGGISGAFSVLDRRAFSTELLFDYGTGQVFGTGLAAGSSTIPIAGASNNRRAILAAVTRDALIADATGQLSFFDSRRAAGPLFLSLLNSAAPQAVLDMFSPVAYAGLTDYALQVTRNFGRDSRQLPALANADGWTLSAGYTGYRNGIAATSDDTNTDFRSNAAMIDVSRRINDRLTVGGIFVTDDGTVRARRFASDVSGQAVGVHLTFQPWCGRRISLEGGATYATHDFENTRLTTTVPAVSQTDADTYDLWSRAKIGVYHNDRVALAAVAGVAYTRTKVEAFAERGSMSALNLRKLEDELLVGEIGTELSAQVTGKVRLVGEAAYEHNFQAPRREVFANFAGENSAFRVIASGFDRAAVRGGARAEYAINRRTTLSAHYSAAIASRSEAAQSFGARLQFCF